MSVEAMTWALNDAPIPAVKSPAASSMKFVLVGLANHAGPDGRHTFPATSTLARYTCLSERTVQRCLDTLAEHDVIRPGDPKIVAAHIPRADRQTQTWDLALERRAKDEQDADQQEQDGVSPCHPDTGPVDNSPADPPERGDTTSPRDGNGVTPCQERGDTVSERGDTVTPEPSLTTQEPPPRAPAHETPGEPVDNLSNEGGGDDAFMKKLRAKRAAGAQPGEPFEAFLFEARDVVQALNDQQPMTPADIYTLMDLYAEARYAGHSKTALHDRMHTNLPRNGAQSPTRLWIWRLRNLPAPETATDDQGQVHTPERCGECEATPRDPVSGRIVWIDKDADQWRWCRACHPKGRSKAAQN